MRPLVIFAFSAALTAEPCRSEPAIDDTPPGAVDLILADPGAALAITSDEGVRHAFRATVTDVFARRPAYAWVWRIAPEDNPVVLLFEVLRDRGIPASAARVLAYSAAGPRDLHIRDSEIAGFVQLDERIAGAVILLPERDLWRVPMDEAGVVLGRAAAIPCIAALEDPPPPYTLGDLPPRMACRALEQWAAP